MDSYDKAYGNWDEMTPSERKSWCEKKTEKIAPMKKQIIQLIGSVKTDIVFGPQ